MLKALEFISNTPETQEKKERRTIIYLHYWSLFMSRILSVTSSYDDRNCDCDDEGDGAGTMVERKVKFGMLPSVSLLDWWSQA